MRRRDGFPAGLVLEPHKRLATRGPVVEVEAPARFVLSLDQGSGATLEPVVPVDSRVSLGQLLARPVDAYGAPLHAPASGRVASIERCDAATDSGRGLCIVLESDGLDTPWRDGDGTTPIDFSALEPAQLIARLQAAGIAGLGGAAFPTATKLEAARERCARRLLLNGAECEPWICCDDALMRTAADDVVLGAQVLMHALDAEDGVLAIEDDKPEAVSAIHAALAAGAGIRPLSVLVVPAVYPQGAERQLVTAAFAVEVPSRGLPADVGVTCQNVATAAAVAAWVRTGRPCTSRIVTVTGSGVRTPANVRARLGTPLAALVEAAGGYHAAPLRLVAGGNMTGRALPSDEAGLTKAINCLFVATRADLEHRLDVREVACIRCGDCAEACPPRLLPQQIHRAVVARDDEAAVALGVWDCIDCGCCDYVCPSGIPLAQRFREARQRLRGREAAAARARDARDRFERHERRALAAAAAEQRAFDAARTAAQAGPAADTASSGRTPT